MKQPSDETRKLELACAPLLGRETDLKKKIAILQSAFFQAHNSGYCDAMANRLMAGQADLQTEYWETACRLKWEVAALLRIYEAEEKGERA